MKKSIFLIPAVALMCACTPKDSYTVTMSLPENLDGQSAFIVADASGAKLDSAAVTNSAATFKGKITSPALATVMVGGYPYAQFVLEPGDITVTDEGIAVGTPSNDAFAAFNDSVAAPVGRLQKASSEEEAQRVFNDEIIPVSLKFIADNPESPFAPPVFMQVAMYMTPEQVSKAVESAPKLKDNDDVKFVAKMAESRAKTSAGDKYTDIQAEHDGQIHKLSQHIKPGQYNLVDFWASWCRPCREEIKTIKTLYDKYHSAGLNVVGVAVNDDPAETRKAMERLDVTWPVILNGGKDVLDTYGIMGIPCIMLIGPDGVIVARDLFGSQLISTVDKAMATAK